MTDYSLVDRLLHRVALGTPALRQLSFDMERQRAKADVQAAKAGQHVLVSGLARAGTSLLLRCLASSGEFAVQTYRDMPFPLAPGLWGKLSQGSRKAATLTERAHGDGLEVSFDTEEAFEEVFWLTMARDDYVRPDALIPHEVPPQTADDYATFVASVLAARVGPTRYLAKNNNNCLRLSGLCRALPEAALIVPFRDPVQHALSLMGQHQRFEDMHRSDPFSRAYMRWLGHFEFGLDHKPFVFGTRPQGTPDAAAYWLDLWVRTHEGILETAPEDTIFWDFEAFCANPQGRMAALRERLQLAEPVASGILDGIAPPPGRDPSAELPKDLQAAAETVHAALVARSLR